MEGEGGECIYDDNDNRDDEDNSDEGENIPLSNSSTCVTKSASPSEDILLFDSRCYQSSSYISSPLPISTSTSPSLSKSTTCESGTMLTSLSLSLSL